MEFIQNTVKENQESPENLGDEAAAQAVKFHRGIPGYQETQLISLEQLSRLLEVKGIFVKDESTRFGLNAFKGLGGTYAMFRMLCTHLGWNPEEREFEDFQKEEVRQQLSQITFITATDGNHGKGVAFAAKLFACKAHVLMPKGSSLQRARAIREAGPAVVEITEKNYDETVELAWEMSRRQGWLLIQDTAWEGYEEVPRWIIQGYLTMAWEAVCQLEGRGMEPTHVFLQAGVGAMAGGVTGYLMNHYRKRRPAVIIAEPEAAACIFLSARAGDGRAHSVEGEPQTMMAGFNCGTPCRITWPILRDFASGYLSCSDSVAAYGMRRYRTPEQRDAPVISGESGAVTLGAAALLLQEKAFSHWKEQMGLGKDSVILLINTEGDTDPESYRAIVT